MPISQEIRLHNAGTIARLVRGREISPVEVVDSALEQIERYDTRLHAFCTLVPDLARRAARRIEKSILKGEPQGPLAGVPIAIKDLVCTRGIRTTFGSKAYEHFLPEEATSSSSGC